MIIYHESELLGKFSYDDEEYKIDGDGDITYIGKSNKPSYLKGCINYSYMFFLRDDLEYLDLSDWDTSKVIKMNFLFYGCYNLKEIKGLENWNINITDIENIDDMFYNYDNVPEWYTTLINNIETIIDGDIIEYEDVLLLNKEE